MKHAEIYLGEEHLGSLKVDAVRGHETWMFHFANDAVRTDRPMLDPDILNVRGPQFPCAQGMFGFLADISPDRWGRRLIRRREGRPLMESDYLFGVADQTRQGAIRLRVDDSFVADSGEDAAPPWTTLRRLEDSARHLDAEDHGEEEERWLKDLFRPGSSLGGARPKANVTAPDGSLWIAKFPSARDEWDVGKREYETSVKARRAGLNVPETQAIRFSKAGTTFFSKRFDRDGKRRIPYASAMTMLGARDGDGGHAYLEIAGWLAQNSADPERDLHELWDRMAFSQLVNNTDDHLRNHGFLLTAEGWRLSPMFDVNANPDASEHALDMGDLFGDCGYYRYTPSEAKARYQQIQRCLQK